MIQLLATSLVSYKPVTFKIAVIIILFTFFTFQNYWWWVCAFEETELKEQTSCTNNDNALLSQEFQKSVSSKQN